MGLSEPKSHQSLHGPTRAVGTRRWRGEVAAMQDRGVRVDPDHWNAAVADLRARGVEATREAADPASADEALHRLIALDSYADEVLGLAALDPEHRVRSTWDPGGSWTGRITARRPAVQSITRQGALRAAVVPAPGCAFVVADWSQAQLRIAFGLSRDPAGMAACAAGRDLHAEIGTAVAGDHPEARSLGKLLNFAILFLAGPDALVEGAAAKGITLTRSEARSLIDRLHVVFPVLCSWRKAQAGRVELPVHYNGALCRMVSLPPHDFDSHGAPRLPAILAGMMQAAEAEALHHVLDHTEMRLGEPLGYRPVLLVHDEVVWEGPEEVSEAAMEAARTLMVEGLAGVTNGVPAVAQVEVRRSWATTA